MCVFIKIFSLYNLVSAQERVVLSIYLFWAGSGSKEVDLMEFCLMFLSLTLIKVLLHLIILHGFFFFLTLGPDRQPRLAVLPPAGLWGSLAVRCGPWYTSGFASISLQSFPA